MTNPDHALRQYDPLRTDPLRIAKDIAEQMIHMPGGKLLETAEGEPLNGQQLARAISSLALLSVATDFRRALELVNKYYWSDEEERQRQLGVKHQGEDHGDQQAGPDAEADRAADTAR